MIILNTANMTKSDVIKQIAEKTGATQEEVLVMVETCLTVIKDSMAEGNEIFIRGFGSFIIKRRASKLARNITANTSVVVPEHYIPMFRPSPDFKELIKNSKEINKLQKV
jgi:DNA-binding protein HU-beta